MKGKIWIISFVMVILLAIFIILNPESHTFPGITIEVLGAFIGVFAAVALGEVIKTFEDLRIATRVHKNLNAELRYILKSLKKNTKQPMEYNTLLWDAAMASGELTKLDRNLLLSYYAAYNKIKGHNITVRQCESLINQPGISSKKEKYLIQAMLESQQVIRLGLEGIIEKLNSNQIEDIAGFFSESTR